MDRNSPTDRVKTKNWTLGSLDKRSQVKMCSHIEKGTRLKDA